MSRSSVQRLAVGDIIIERVNGKQRMTPVRKVEFNACSSWGVHVNRSACYDFNAVVDVVDGDGTLGDMEKELTGLGDRDEDMVVAGEISENMEMFFDSPLEKIEGLVFNGEFIPAGGPDPHLQHIHVPLNLEDAQAWQLADRIVRH